MTNLLIQDIVVSGCGKRGKRAMSMESFGFWTRSCSSDPPEGVVSARLSIFLPPHGVRKEPHMSHCHPGLPWLRKRSCGGQGSAAEEPQLGRVSGENPVYLVALLGYALKQVAVGPTCLTRGMQTTVRGDRDVLQMRLAPLRIIGLLSVCTITIGIMSQDASALPRNPERPFTEKTCEEARARYDEAMRGSSLVSPERNAELAEEARQAMIRLCGEDK